MKNKIIDYTQAIDKLTENEPHEVAELICISCGFRYIGVYPQKTYLKNLECSQCHKTGSIIKTGQTLEDEEGNIL